MSTSLHHLLRPKVKKYHHLLHPKYSKATHTSQTYNQDKIWIVVSFKREKVVVTPRTHTSV
ncbi:hypothetical protein Hdeb2414_s0004g00148981 [Helianthus debilis subsp. tardiflorus]